MEETRPNRAPKPAGRRARFMSNQFSEKQVEDYIFKNQLLAEYGVRCIARQVRFGAAGTVDILGYSKGLCSWVVVEIKRDRVDAHAYAQLNRYLEWFSRVKCRNALGLLIGESMDDSLKFVPPVYCEGWNQAGVCHALFEVTPIVELDQYSTASKKYLDITTEEEGAEYQEILRRRALKNGG